LRREIKEQGRVESTRQVRVARRRSNGIERHEHET